MDKQKCEIPVGEWESISFPMLLKDLKINRGEVKFEKSTTIEIWRDEYFQLHGKICGDDVFIVSEERNKFIGKGNIVKDDQISGFDDFGNEIVINGCVIGNSINLTPKYIDGYIKLEANLIFDSFYQLNTISHSDTNKVRFDWFLISEVVPDFAETTFRRFEKPHIKARLGLDDFDPGTVNYIGSFNKDFSQLKTNGFECLMGKVPDRFLPADFQGFFFEFRGENLKKATKELINDLKYFIGFLLGTQLYYLGFNVITNGKTVEGFADNPDLPRRLPKAMPPIHYTLHHDWGKFWLLINQFFPKYIEHQKSLQLNAAIERLWLYKTLPVGTNLPTLSSGLEIIAANYLKMQNVSMVYLEEDDFLNKIKPELSLIRSKLDEVTDSDIIINKIKVAYRKSANEKMRLFFAKNGIELGKDEKSAVGLRNSMAHGARDYSDDKRVHNDLYLTRVYEVLFNKTILRILGYDEYYKDYSVERCPSKKITICAGKNH